MLLHLILMGFQTIANNDPIVTRWNETRDGEFCSSVLYSSLQSVSPCEKFPEGMLLDRGQKNSLYLLTSQDAFESLFFRKAGEIQSLKNNCLIDQLQLMENRIKSGDQKDLHQLTLRWLQFRKILISQDKCESKIRGPLRLSPDTTTEKAFEVFLQAKKKVSEAGRSLSSLESLSEDFINQCLDHDRFKALMSADQVLLLTLPILQAQSALELIERHRAELILAQTGKPVTDQDIFNLDFSAVPAHSPGNSSGKGKAPIVFSKPFVEDFKGFIGGTILSRQKIEKRIQDEIVGPAKISTRNEELRDFIFNDGTAGAAAVELNLLENPGYKCVLARYQSSALGELLSTTTVTVGGTALVKVLTKIPKALSVARFLRLKLSPGRAGGLIAAGVTSYKSLEQTCLREVYSQRKLPSANLQLSETALENAAINLSPSMGLSQWPKKEIPKEISPACQKLHTSEFSQLKEAQLSCLQDFAVNTTPWNLGVVTSEVLSRWFAPD